jgi:hypothetical protein
MAIHVLGRPCHARMTRLILTYAEFGDDFPGLSDGTSSLNMVVVEALAHEHE